MFTPVSDCTRLPTVKQTSATPVPTTPSAVRHVDRAVASSMFVSEKSMEQRPGNPGTQGVQRTRLWRQVRAFAPVRVVRMSDAKQSAAVTVPNIAKAV
jgi:hypothetical protein